MAVLFLHWDPTLRIKRKAMDDSDYQIWFPAGLFPAWLHTSVLSSKGNKIASELQNVHSSPGAV